MKYADEQLVRPQQENGCDYGHGRRSVLVRNGEQQLLHIAGQKHWGGVGSYRRYSGTEIVIYPDERGVCKQYLLAEGRMTGRLWEHIAEKIYKHLGTSFDLKLISLKHTLLLDEPGEVTEPPPREPGPKKLYPRIESDKLYRVFQDDADTCKIVTFTIVKQHGGKITYRYGDVPSREKSTKQLIEEGHGGTREEAIALYLRYYEEKVAEATVRLQRAAQSFSYHDDNLTEAKQRIEAMLK